LAEYNKYSSELSEHYKTYEMLVKLNKLDMYFQQVSLTGNLTLAKNYPKIISVLEKISEILHSSSDRILPRLECYHILTERYRFLYENTIYKLNQKFEELVEFNLKPLKQITTSIIKITKNSAQLSDIISALAKTNFNSSKMSKFLLNHVLIPIITKPVALVR
jgi:hypothetical protein